MLLNNLRLIGFRFVYSGPQNKLPMYTLLYVEITVFYSFKKHTTILCKEFYLHSIFFFISGYTYVQS